MKEHKMATDTTRKSWVQKRAEVCGGDACLLDTRITVWGLVQGRKLGASEASLLQNIVGLTPDDLEAAWDYYRRNATEIDEAIRLNEEP
jgi:uncharacterized protein (DUF433 family)